jgi:hypothetical protein
VEKLWVEMRIGVLSLYYYYFHITTDFDFDLVFTQDFESGEEFFFLKTLQKERIIIILFLVSLAFSHLGRA